MNATVSAVSPAAPPTPAALTWEPSDFPDEGTARDPEWPVGQRLYPDYVPEYDDTLSPDDPEYYPCHPEIAVVESQRHVMLLVFLLDVLRALLPGRGVFSRLAVYWAPGERDVFGAPDLMVTAARPARDPITSYLAFRDPPIQCVIEVVSAGNEQKDLDKKFADYQNELAVPEYLLLDPIRNTLVLYRLERGRYTVAPAPANRRVWSEQCRAWFAWDPQDHLRIWDVSGIEQRKYVELLNGESQARAQAEAELVRAEAERIRADAERTRADRLAARLRELGLDPDA